MGQALRKVNATAWYQKKLKEAKRSPYYWIEHFDIKIGELIYRLKIWPKR